MKRSVRRYGKSLRVSLTAGALICTQVPFASSAEAAIFCEAAIGNYFDGARLDFVDDNVRGARARIEYVNPDLCDNDTTGPSSSSAWVMVTDFVGYAQAGWSQYGAATGYTQGIHEFAQWWQKCNYLPAGCGSGSGFVTAYGKSPSDLAYYVAKFQNNDARVHMYADGGQLTQTNYNPDGEWSDYWNAQYFGETFHLGTDVPGTTADKVQFDYIQTYDTTDTTRPVQEDDLTVVTDSDKYKHEFYIPASNTAGFKIWTDRS